MKGLFIMCGISPASRVPSWYHLFCQVFRNYEWLYSNVCVLAYVEFDVILSSCWLTGSLTRWYLAYRPWWHSCSQIQRPPDGTKTTLGREVMIKIKVGSVRLFMLRWGEMASVSQLACPSKISVVLSEYDPTDGWLYAHPMQFHRTSWRRTRRLASPKSGDYRWHFLTPHWRRRCVIGILKWCSTLDRNRQKRMIFCNGHTLAQRFIGRWRPTWSYMNLRWRSSGIKLMSFLVRIGSSIDDDAWQWFHLMYANLKRGV